MFCSPATAISSKCRPCAPRMSMSQELRPKACRTCCPRPGTSPVRTAAPAPLRLPASKDVFLLDGRVGDESIVCIAADQELPEVTLSQYLGSTPPAEQGNGREIPPALTDKNRGKTAYYLGKVQASGVLGLRFSFQRQK